MDKKKTKLLFDSFSEYKDQSDPPLRKSSMIVKRKPTTFVVEKFQPKKTAFQFISQTITWWMQV